MKSVFLACIHLLLVSGLALAQSNGVPLLTQPLIPASVAPGSKKFTLTINGTGFGTNAQVYWNGSIRSTTVVSSSQLQAQINAADVAKAGVAWVTVGNLGSSEVFSNVIYFPIRTPALGLGFVPRSIQNVLSPGPFVVGDFNNDGLLDFAVASDTTLQVFLGKGNGTFQPPVVTNLKVHVASLTSGDFSGDGKLDLAAGGTQNNRAKIVVLLGRGNGKFSQKRGFNGGFVMSAADFNGDGNLDLYVASGDKNGPLFTILLGNGEGEFGGGIRGHYFDCGEGPPTFGDFNGDGLLDVAAIDCGALDVFLNSPVGFGTESVYAMPFGGTHVAAADVNGDGKLDLVTDGGSVLLGNGDGTFQNGEGIASGASGSVNLGDFNGDGKLDIAAGASILLGNGNGTFQTPLTFAGLSSTSPISIGGFNADGGLDLLGVDTLNGALTIAVQVPAYFTPINLDFEMVTIGTTSPPQTATLTNFGATPLPKVTVTITGTNAADFAQTNNCPPSLPPNGTCMIQTTFAPSIVGSESAALNVTYRGSTTLSMPLSGIGTHQANTVTLTPSSLTYSTQLVGTMSPSKAATLTNTGNQAITVANIVATGPFSQTNNCPSSLPVGSSCNINVVFAPTDGGFFNGTLSVTDNAIGSPQQVALSGTGTAVTLSPLAINFGNEKVGSTSVPIPITLTNLGTSTLAITGIKITGTNAGDFKQTNNCGKAVAPQGQCKITVTFAPKAKGGRSAEVVISDSDPTSPQSVPLSGNGT